MEYDPDTIELSPQPWNTAKFEIYDCDGMIIGSVKHHPGDDHVKFRLKEKRMTLIEWKRLDKQIRQLFVYHVNTGSIKK